MIIKRGTKVVFEMNTNIIFSLIVLVGIIVVSIAAIVQNANAISITDVNVVEKVVVKEKVVPEEWKNVSNTLSSIEKIDDFVLEAMISVESNGDRFCWNRKEKAAGVLQIRPCVLVDLMKYHLGHFDPNDRWNVEKSKMICRLYVSFWCDRLHLDANNPEVVARLWNGGPDGLLEVKTASYWKRVEDVMID